MKIAVIAWGETVRQQALEASAALAPLDSRELELWTFGAGVKEEWFRDLPVQNVLILNGLGDLYTGIGQYVETFLHLMREREMELAVFPDSEKGMELAARVSAGLGTAASFQVTGLRTDESGILLERKVYSCNLEGWFRAPKGPFAMSFDKNAMEESMQRGAPDILRMQVPAEQREEFSGYEEKILPESGSLEHAKRLVVAGRGAADRDTLELLGRISQALDASLGATRPAVLDAMLPYSSMIGMTGVIARPELCLVFGASGSAPFMIGVRDSQVLAAVNHNPDAAIFRSCDLAVVDDVGDFAAAFLEVVREKEGRS